MDELDAVVLYLFEVVAYFLLLVYVGAMLSIMLLILLTIAFGMKKEKLVEIQEVPIQGRPRPLPPDEDDEDHVERVRRGFKMHLRSRTISIPEEGSSKE